MKSTVDAKAFSAALDKVSKVLRKSAVPIIEQICVRFEGDRCICTATDLITWVSVELPAQGDVFSFAFTKTRDVVKVSRFFDGNLVVELRELGGAKKESPRITLTCGYRAVEYDAYPGDDYPPAPQTADEDVFTTNAGILLKRVSRVCYAVDKKASWTDTYPIQACIQFNGTQVYALDGARAACDTDETLVFPRAFLSPFESVRYLKLFGDRLVSFRFGKRNLCVADGQVSIICPLVGKEPFHMQSAVPSQITEEFYVQPKAFLAELRYMKECVTKIKLPYVDFINGEMSMADSIQKCRTAVALEGESKTPILFNLHHMIDAIRQFEGEERVRVKVSSCIAPLIIDAEGRSDYALVCPIKPKKADAA
jgi:DNA polymerase III sliding clamp (beta) subunit (PCNA family)